MTFNVLTTAQAAKLIGVSDTAIRNFIRWGYLAAEGKSSKHGHSWLITRRALDDFMGSRRYARLVERRNALSDGGDGARIDDMGVACLVESKRVSNGA